MSKNPADRYQSVEGLKNDLEDFLEGSERFPGRTYKPGALIVREGDSGNEAYIIRSGECLAFKTINDEKVELRIMEAGDVFGETAILTDKPRSASVEAVTNVTVAVIKSQYFEEELQAGSWLGPFIRALAERCPLSSKICPYPPFQECLPFSTALCENRLLLHLLPHLLKAMIDIDTPELKRRVEF